MTSDGIATEDWDAVRAAAEDVVNASAMEDEVMVGVHTERLFEVLDGLEERYGRLPSILATQGDFTDGPEKVVLWKEAYGLALARGDARNQLFTVQSLAEHFCEVGEKAEAMRWVEIGERVLAECPDDHVAGELREIRRKAES